MGKLVHAGNLHICGASWEMKSMLGMTLNGIMGSVDDVRVALSI